MTSKRRQPGIADEPKFDAAPSDVTSHDNAHTAVTLLPKGEPGDLVLDALSAPAAVLELGDLARPGVLQEAVRPLNGTTPSSTEQRAHEAMEHPGAQDPDAATDVDAQVDAEANGEGVSANVPGDADVSFDDLSVTERAQVLSALSSSIVAPDSPDAASSDAPGVVLAASASSNPSGVVLDEEVPEAPSNGVAQVSTEDEEKAEAALRVKARRRGKLDKERLRKLCQALAAGNYIEAACVYAGISVATYRHWVTLGEQYPRSRYGQAGREIAYALASAEVRIVAQWQSHMPRNWAACAAFLERRYPDKWARYRAVAEGARGSTNVNVNVQNALMQQAASPNALPGAGNVRGLLVDHAARAALIDLVAQMTPEQEVELMKEHERLEEAAGRTRVRTQEQVTVVAEGVTVEPAAKRA